MPERRNTLASKSDPSKCVDFATLWARLMYLVVQYGFMLGVTISWGRSLVS